MEKSYRPVAIWLLVGVGMIIIQIILGGITRLTGSGLSITEWDVITGSLPPLNPQQWNVEFEKYKQTPQYSYLNSDFTISDFKFIFFWEWLHRFWARLIGVVFAVPFVIFLLQKRFKTYMIKPLIILFLLGALQGAVGWIMVASGLEGDAIYVKPTRLALHFIFALGLLCYTLWFALQLLVKSTQRFESRSIYRLSFLILVLLFVQLIYGALMAGHKAATAAPTWPDINGAVVPAGLFRDGGLINLINDKILIHFIHRGVAYIIFILIVLLTVRLYRKMQGSLLQKVRYWPLILVSLQVVLGIFAVLISPKIIPNYWGAFEWLALFHQLTAMFLLISMLMILYMTARLKGQIRN